MEQETQSQTNSPTVQGPKRRKSSGSEYSFKSLDQQEVAIPDQAPKRPTYQQQLRLLKIYRANQSRKQLLLQKIQYLQEQKAMKMKLEQLRLDKLVSHMIISQDSDSENEPDSASMQRIKKDYESKKGVLDKLQSHYQQFKKSMAAMVLQLQLNGSPALQNRVKQLYEVVAYEFMPHRTKLAVLYKYDSGAGVKGCRVLFRSLGIPENSLKPFQVGGEGSFLDHLEDLLLIVVDSVQFHIYDIAIQKQVIKSAPHESAIKYAKIIKKQGTGVRVLTVTQKGYARIFDLQKKQLVFLAICSNGEAETSAVPTHYLYSPIQELLLFSIQHKLYSLSLINKKVTEVLSFQKSIIKLALSYIWTRDGIYNNYEPMLNKPVSIQSAQTYISIELSPSIIAKWYPQLLLINQKSHSIAPDSALVCVYRRKHPETRAAEALLVFGDPKGMLRQWNVQL